jgi:phosphopantothenate synthetase
VEDGDRREALDRMLKTVAAPRGAA